MKVSDEMKAFILHKVASAAIDKAMSERCSGVNAAKTAVTQVAKAAHWLSTDEPDIYAQGAVEEMEKTMEAN